MPGMFPLPIQSHHHLDSLAAEVHRTSFYKVPPLPVRWGQEISRKRRRSIRLGSYNHATAEVRIHPSLNAPNVPAFFIQSIIYHEYLHHVLGASHNRRFHGRFPPSRPSPRVTPPPPGAGATTADSTRTSGSSAITANRRSGFAGI